MEGGRGTGRLRAMAVMVVVVVVSGMVVAQGQSNPFFNCYVGCFVLCSIIPTHTAYGCALECLKDCVVPNTPQGFGIHSDNISDNHSFCKLGCASSLCTNISTKQNPGGEKVERCVNSCSEGCTKNYLSP